MNSFLMLSLRDKMKHVFIVPIVWQVALDDVPLRNGPISLKQLNEVEKHVFSVKS